MEIVDCIEKLKSEIKYAYNETKKTLGDNIYRGHSKAISSDIEDGIALFISRLQPSCKIFLDPSIHIDRKTHRPDLLVINNKNEVIAMVEIKANMGNTTTETFYQYIRAKIYDKYYQELLNYFEPDPQCPQVRSFMNDVSIYIYCYNNKVYVTRKPINTSKHIRQQRPEEVKKSTKNV